jgi:hypothetical protein
MTLAGHFQDLTNVKNKGVEPEKLATNQGCRSVE